MEYKQQSEDPFTSPSVEISYTERASKLSLASQTSAHSVMDIAKGPRHEDELHSDSVSSHYEEDDDSKMMELPADIPIFIADDDAVRIPLTPKQRAKALRGPMGGDRASPLRLAQSAGSNYKIVGTLCECTVDAEPARCFERVLFALNAESPHCFWRRLALRFSLGFLLCSAIAVTATIELGARSAAAVYGAAAVFMAPFVVFCAFALRICAKYHSSNLTPPDTVSIEESPFFRDRGIRERVIGRLNRSNHFSFEAEKNMVYSWNAGYSAFASLNSILSAIYGQSLFVQFPSKPRKTSLRDLYEVIQSKIVGDFEVDIQRFPRIKVEVELIDCEFMGYRRFRALVTANDEDHYVRTFFIAQFNKQPLFYCDGSSHGLAERVRRWVAERGYFSAIIGSHTEQNGECFVLAMDCDPKVEGHLVPAHRMHEAIQCRDLRGECGGLLRIRAHFIL